LCAPSNAAANNLLRRVSQIEGIPPDKIMRFCSTDFEALQVDEDLRKFTPAAMLNRLKQSYADGDMKDLYEFPLLYVRRPIEHCYRNRPQDMFKFVKFDGKQEEKPNWKQFNDHKKIHDRLIRKLIDKCTIVITTNASAGHNFLRRRKPFTVVLLDEATQEMEAGALIPILCLKEAGKVICTVFSCHS